MIKEGEKITTGSVHKDDIFMVHDVLILITVKTKITWMRKHNYLHRWLIFFNSLQDGMPYSRRSIGNSPKFMPLDNIPNRDNFQCLRFYCILSRFF